MSSPPATPGAVFLSYAREDAAAALRIADALRGFGVEVWFDQSELRGGDAWDQKIRKEIKECALFVPVISAHTEERHEGYFRLEWSLAEERTHLMARGLPFILPVVIDATNEARAVVPERFREVQWFKLPGGEPKPEFLERLKRLIEQPRKSPFAGHAVRSDAPARPPAAVEGPRDNSLPVRRPRTDRLWVGMGLAVGAIALGLWFAWSRFERSKSEPAAPKSSAGDVVSAKSIAVLPFANMSEDKQGSAFFSDGIHEDILTNLALIRDLHVVSRTSVEQYRGTKKTMREIGDELRVAYILEGSVRRAGNTVRVTGQLINARTDEHLWAKSFDRELKDVFAIQTALAQEIAGAMKAAISPTEQKLLDRRPTENVAAYDLYLKARELLRAPNGTASSARQVTLLQAAVDLDPKFAAAWAHLCFAHGWLYFFDRDHTPARQAQARAAMEKTISLGAETPEAMRAKGDYLYYGLRDFAGAARQYDELNRLFPNSVEGHSLLSAVYRRMGRWADAATEASRVAQADPGDLLTLGSHAGMLITLRRYAQARTMTQRMIELEAPAEKIFGRLALARIALDSTGSARELHELIAGLSPAQANSPVGKNLRLQAAFATGKVAEYLAIDREVTDFASGDEPAQTSGIGAVLNNRVLTSAVALMVSGDSAAAKARLHEVAALRLQIEEQPENARMLALLGAMEALLGEKDAAVRHARKAVELGPESVDAAFGPVWSLNLAFVYAWTGDKGRAIAEYARLLRVPGAGGANIYEMKSDLRYYPLRDEPRFQALLNDPKNNEPLF